MVLEPSLNNWAYSEDIPGSRCGPEDGPWPRPYRLLEEDDLWRELRVLARPHSLSLGTQGNFKADSVNFQPSPVATQDRYVVTQLEVHGRLWTFTGVFDGESSIISHSHRCLTPSPHLVFTGHLGDVTVEHVAQHLPIIVRDFLREADPSVHLGTYLPQAISELFTKAMLAFDDAIAHDVLDLFGGSIEKLEEYTDAEIRDVINDQHLGGTNWRKVRLCMYGTTALVALVDPSHKDLWVANLGDCQAGKWLFCIPPCHTLMFLVLTFSFLVMVSPGRSAKEWIVDILSTSHNGDNDAELERVQKEHPNEPECIVDRRVLGALAPTRCKLLILTHEENS